MTCLSSKQQAELEARQLAEPFVGEVLHQVDRIMASQKFERVQQRARDFLAFVVSMKLLGRATEIKETIIAVAVWGEKADYDTSHNPKVRVAALELRKKLREYYAEEGEHDPIEISLPDGSYVPEICQRHPTIRVNPFENWNPEDDQAHLCPVISTEIADRLIRSGRVRVQTQPVMKSEVRYSARGSFECFNGTIRLNVSVSDMFARQVIFGESFQGRRDDLFKLSREVAAALLDVLKPEDHHSAGGLKKDVERFETLQLYQQGRYHLARRTAADIRKAISLFEQTTESDGRYARAYSGLADGYLVLSWYEVSPPDRVWFEKAKSCALSGVALNPGLPEVHTSLAYAKLLCDFDWEGAEEEFRQAILIQNRYAPAHHWYANLLTMQGRFEEAEEEIKRASYLDSGSIVIRKTLGDPYYYSRRFDRAIEAYRAAIKKDPHFWMAHLFLGWSYQHAGDRSKALQEFDCVIAQAGPNSIVQGAIAHLHASSGHEAEAISILTQLKAQPGAPYVAPHSVAAIYEGLGESDQAFAWLEASYESRIELLAWIKVDPRFHRLRVDPRFGQFLERIGLSSTTPNVA